jgi:hypothetical protein
MNFGKHWNQMVDSEKLDYLRTHSDGGGMSEKDIQKIVVKIIDQVLGPVINSLHENPEFVMALAIAISSIPKETIKKAREEKEKAEKAKAERAIAAEQAKKDAPLIYDMSTGTFVERPWYMK